jgi:hypothetical protein
MIQNITYQWWSLMLDVDVNVGARELSLVLVV